MAKKMAFSSECLFKKPSSPTLAFIDRSSLSISSDDSSIARGKWILKCHWLQFISQWLPSTGQSLGVQSLVRTLFLLATIFIYIYICIYWPFLAQTLTPLEAFLPPYVEGLIPLPSPIMMFIQSTLRLHGHSSLMMSCYNKSISGYDLLLFKGKIPFPYIALALCSTWSHHSVRFWHLLFYFIHSVVAMWVTCETLSSGMMLML